MALVLTATDRKEEVREDARAKPLQSSGRGSVMRRCDSALAGFQRALDGALIARLKKIPPAVRLFLLGGVAIWIRQASQGPIRVPPILASRVDTLGRLLGPWRSCISEALVITAGPPRSMLGQTDVPYLVHPCLLTAEARHTERLHACRGGSSPIASALARCLSL
jgi:hypothetical protein